MDPKKVVSPKAKVSNVVVIHNDGEFAIATLQWNKENRIGIRWNGEGENNLGYPQSRKYPTWFIMPKSVALAYAYNINNPQLVAALRATSDKPFA